MIFAYLMARLLFLVVLTFIFIYLFWFALDPTGVIQEIKEFFTKEDKDA